MSLTASEIDVTVGLTIGGTPYNVSPLNSPGTNTTSLQQLLNALVSSTGPSNGSGGTLIFPSVGGGVSYRFAGSVTVGGQGATAIAHSIVIKGDGQQKVTVPLLVQTEAYDFFVINTNDNTAEDDAGGVVFQDLMIAYEPSAAMAGNSAIKVTNKSQGTRLFRVTLLNWPIGVYFNDSTQCRMIDCTVLEETELSSIAPIGVQLGDPGGAHEAVETYIAGCLFFDNTNSGTAIQAYGCDHIRVMNCRLEEWLTGIAITPGGESENAQYMHFENVSCYPYSTMPNTGGPALLITTSGSESSPKFVFHVTFVACELSAPVPTSNSPETGYTGSGVIIGPTGAVDDLIDQIRFIDCHVCFWQGPGLQIIANNITNTLMSPTNVEVVGGYYSLNGSSAAGELPFAGILITGGLSGPSGIRITGAACNNSLLNTTTHDFATATQQYGFYLSGAASSVRVNACDFTGNLANGVYINGTSTSKPLNVFVRDSDFTALSTPVTVSGPVSNLQIVDCPGYNDQGTLITNASPTLNTPLTIAQLGSTPYYGPGECYVNGAHAVKIDGQTSPIQTGSFYLQPLETIEIDTSVTGFLAIGK